MHSRLDPIFKTQLWHTENLDTRQGIRRQENDEDGRRRRKKEAKNDKKDLWEDRPSVSVRALRAFLEELVRQAEKPVPSEIQEENLSLSVNAPQTGEDQEKGTESRIKTERAAKAAQAYQRTYRATHEETQQTPLAGTMPAIELRPEELRIINLLIRDLDALANENIERIELEESASFLQSLVNAVSDMKKEE